MPLFSVRRHHAGLPRAFDLSVAGYFLDFVLAPIAGVLLIGWAASYGFSWWLIALAILAGVLAWSLAEYWIHRAIFHGATRFAPMHDLHHRLPRDLIGVASWGTVTAFAGLLLIACTFAGPALGSAFTAGAIAGYLAYCAIHVRFHHHGEGARLSAYVAFMNAHHLGHHRGGRGNFGVSSPIWDFVFGTYRPSR